MQLLSPRRPTSLRVMLVNVALALSGIVLFIGYFGGSLEGSRFAGGLALVFGAGCVADGVLRRIGWMTGPDHSSAPTAPLLILFGASVMVAGVLMLRGG